MAKKIKTLRKGEGGRSTVRVHIGHGPRGCTAKRTAGRRGSAEKPHTLLHALFGRGTAPDALQPAPDALQPYPDAPPAQDALLPGPTRLPYRTLTARTHERRQATPARREDTRKTRPRAAHRGKRPVALLSKLCEPAKPLRVGQENTTRTRLPRAAPKFPQLHYT